MNLLLKERILDEIRSIGADIELLNQKREELAYGHYARILYAIQISKLRNTKLNLEISLEKLEAAYPKET